MRIRKALISTAVSLTIGIFFTPSARAQSFFQKLFGSPAQAPQTQTYQSRPQTIPPHRFSRLPAARPRQMLPSRDEERADEDIGPPDGSGTYRTVCVRTCDGFYFPLRAGATHKNFAADVKSCRTACGSDARLFYSPSWSAEGADALVDLAGRKYSSLPHAFAYRKALVEGCTCKPVPWSVEEEQRHRGYAEQEQIEKAKDAAYLAEKAKAAQPAQAEPSGAAKATAADDGDRKLTPRPDGSVVTAAAEQDAPPLQAAQATPPETTPETTPAAANPSLPPAVAAPTPDEQVDRRRRTSRQPRVHSASRVQRVRYTPTSSPFSGFGKSKYAWPGDR